MNTNILTERSMITKRFATILFIGIAFFAAVWIVTSGATVSRAQGGFLIFVNSTGDGGNIAAAPNCDADPAPGVQCTLRAAIQAANASPGADGIDIAIPSSEPNCVATGECVIGLGSALPDLTEGVDINGPGPGLLTVRRVLSEPDHFSIFTSTTTGVVGISGLTVSGGAGSGPNGSGPGGGIYSLSTGTINILNSMINGNGNLIDAGGIVNSSAGSINLTGSSVTGNHGTGIRNNGGTVNVVNSTVSNNTGTVTGGIESTGTLNVRNSTISDNGASFGGGGVRSTGTLRIENSTIARNSVADGINGVGGVSGTGSIRSSIVALNTNAGGSSVDLRGTFTSEGYNVFGSTAGATVTSGVADQFGVVEAQLNLSPLQDNGGPTHTMAIGCSSVALDAGFAGTPTTDQRGTGFPRVAGPSADVGSYELQGCNVAPTISSTPMHRPRGSSGNFQIATVSDAEDAEQNLVITLNAGSSVNINGVSVSNLAVNSLGVVTADIAVSCGASQIMPALGVTDSDGSSTYTTLDILVDASDPPVISLKPPRTVNNPNGTYRKFTVNEMIQSATDDCGGNMAASVVIEKATSDEADNAPGNGDGNTVNDIRIGPNCRKVRLRAERNSNGNGRVYNVTLKVADSEGQVTRAVYKVAVPVNLGGAAIEGSIQATVLGGCP